MKPAPSWIAFAPSLFVVLWATGFVVARLSADHVEPLTFLSFRFPIAGALFVAIALYQRATWPNATHAFHAAVAGALLHGGYIWGPSTGRWRMACLLALRFDCWLATPYDGHSRSCHCGRENFGPPLAWTCGWHPRCWPCGVAETYT